MNSISKFIARNPVSRTIRHAYEEAKSRRENNPAFDPTNTLIWQGLSAIVSAPGHIVRYSIKSPYRIQLLIRVVYLIFGRRDFTEKLLTFIDLYKEEKYRQYLLDELPGYILIVCYMPDYVLNLVMTNLKKNIDFQSLGQTILTILDIVPELKNAEKYYRIFKAAVPNKDIDSVEFDQMGSNSDQVPAIAAVWGFLNTMFSNSDKNKIIALVNTHMTENQKLEGFQALKVIVVILQGYMKQKVEYKVPKLEECGKFFHASDMTCPLDQQLQRFADTEKCKKEGKEKTNKILEFVCQLLNKTIEELTKPSGKEDYYVVVLFVMAIVHELKLMTIAQMIQIQTEEELPALEGESGGNLRRTLKHKRKRTRRRMDKRRLRHSLRKRSSRRKR